MRYRWITIPTLAVGMMALAVSNGLAQRGGPGGGRGSFSPDEVWARYGGGAGDTIDLNKNPQAAMMIKSKGYSVPPDGILRKADFLPQVAARMQSMGMGGPPGGGAPGMGGPPSAAPSGDKPAVILVPGEEPQPQPGSDRGRGGPPGSDRGGDRGRGGPPGGGEDRGRGGPPGWGDRGGDRGSRGGDEARKGGDDLDEERPNVLRYGKTPKELPGWFIELDTDKDAQIGLYEWRNAGKSLEDFLEKDLNGDGFLTVDEVLKSPTSGKTESTKSDSRGGNTFGKGGPSSSNDPRSKDNGSGNGFGKSKDKTEAKPSKEEKKSEPSGNGGNPFLKK